MTTGNIMTTSDLESYKFDTSEYVILNDGVRMTTSDKRIEAVGVDEDALELAFWAFDANHKKHGMQRDEFKRQMRGYARQMAHAHYTQLEKRCAELESILEAVKSHAVAQDCGRLCDNNKGIIYREQWKRSEAFVDNIIKQALKGGDDAKG